MLLFDPVQSDVRRRWSGESVAPRSDKGQTLSGRNIKQPDYGWLMVASLFEITWLVKTWELLVLWVGGTWFICRSRGADLNTFFFVSSLQHGSFRQIDRLNSTWFALNCGMSRCDTMWILDFQFVESQDIQKLSIFLEKARQGLATSVMLHGSGGPETQS